MNDLLTLDDIAAMWKCDRRHARDVLVKLAAFPEKAPGSTLKNPVWLRSEVRAYANRKPKTPAQFPQHGPQPA
jgi:hypothetical protein